MPALPPVPADQPAVMPHLIVKGGARAIAFYVRAFEARELFRLTEPSGKLGHAELAVGNARFAVADEYPDFGALGPTSVGGTPVSLHVYVADVDAVAARAVEAGATLLRPVRDEFYGDRVATLVDPFGHRWQVASRREDVSPAEMQRRFEALFA